MRLVSLFYLVILATIACNQSPVESAVSQTPPAADNVECLDDNNCAGQTKSKCYRLPGQTDKGTCARWCSTDDFCGPPGKGAMCLKPQGAASTDGGICVRWEINRKDVPVANWQAGKDHCIAIKTETERWVMPTKAELKYLCRTKIPYDDLKPYIDDVCPTCSCPHARRVLGIDSFELKTWWSSTCRPNPNIEKESRMDDSACLSYVWAVDFSSGTVLPVPSSANDLGRLLCVRPD